MNLFNSAATDSAYSRWQDPRSQHDIDACESCHESGNHEDGMLFWKEKCVPCAVELVKKASNVVLELIFKPEDIELALYWAKRKGYDYNGEKVEHLLHDAMLDGAVQPTKWTAL